MYRSTIALLFFLFFFSAQAVSLAQDTGAVPDAVSMLETSGQDLFHILLLGSDTDNPQNSGRTDAIILVSINRSAGYVALLSIPRDLYVYIPGTGMNRINTAYALGETRETGRGPQLLIDTIAYNLGLHVDRYVRVDFQDFKHLVDGVGGLDLAVDCAIQDWRLIEPDMDPAVEDNWAMFTLPIGIQHLDGDLALWYARSRRSSSDLDRGQRQQAIMRGLWQRIRQLGLLEQIGDVWPQVLDIVETDMSLQDVIGLTPMALQMDSSRLSSFHFELGREVRNWVDPTGASVLLLEAEPSAAMLAGFLLPPTLSQIADSQPTVQIMDGSGREDLAMVAASKLAWEGFVTQIGERPSTAQQLTTIVDHTGGGKGGYIDQLQELLRVDDASVIVSPDPMRSFDYEVVIGWSFYACTRNVQAPTLEPDA